MKTQKKRKVLFGIGILVVVLALGGWLFFEFNQTWLSVEDSFDVTWSEEDATFCWDNGTYDVIIHTREPVAYAFNERIVLRDGIRMRSGRPFISLRDNNIMNKGVRDAIAAIRETDTSRVGVIAAGLYGQGTEEQKASVYSLTGDGVDGRRRFELYFNWYNNMHEVGHMLGGHYGTQSSRHMVEEEQLVNSFAIAFWSYYGEAEKLEELEATVKYVLSNVTPPVDNMSHLEYVRQEIDKGNYGNVYNVNTYGWFQYNIVLDALRERDSLDLASILAQMGVENVNLQPGQKLTYQSVGADMIPEILADATSVLRGSGVDVPDIYIMFDTDPMGISSKGIFPYSLLEPRIAEGRLIPAFR